MTASNATIRQTIFDALDLPGVNRYKYPEDSITVPAVVVAGLDITPVAKGARETSASIMVVVSHSDSDQLVTLDRLLDEDDTGSVIHAIENVTNVNGVSLSWQSAGSYGEVVWNGITYYGAVVSVKVWT